jgi:allophanate hydrolase subunit 2
VQARLVEEPFRATQRMDRMGMVLDGPRLVPLRLDMPSEAIVRGALQADGEGRVTLLLADHQTTGGYPRVATLLSGDADRVAQLPPGAAFRISLVSPARAVAIVRAERARQQDFLAGLATDEPLEARLMRHNLITARVEPEA